MAFRNEFDFDSPDAIDFDILVEKLTDLKHGYKALSHPLKGLTREKENARRFLCILLRSTHEKSGLFQFTLRMF